MKRFLCAAVTMAMAAVSARAEAPRLDADPFAVLWVGDQLVALGQDSQLWRRDRPEGSAWHRIELRPEDAGGNVVSMSCAADQSAMCLVTIEATGRRLFQRLDMATGTLTPLSPANGEVIAMPDRNTVYLQQKGEDGTHVMVLDLKTGTETSLGPLAGDENAAALPIDGRLTPVAYSLRGTMRVVGQDDIPVQFSWNDNLISLPEGVLVRETWSAEPALQPGRRAVAVFRFMPGRQDGKKIITAHMDTLGAWPVSALCFPRTMPRRMAMAMSSPN